MDGLLPAWHGATFGPQWIEEPGDPISFGVAEEPPGPRSDSSYPQVLQAALGLCVSSGVLPLRWSNVIHPSVTTHTSLPPRSLLVPQAHAAARCSLWSPEQVLPHLCSQPQQPDPTISALHPTVVLPLGSAPLPHRQFHWGTLKISLQKLHGLWHPPGIEGHRRFPLLQDRGGGWSKMSVLKSNFRVKNSLIGPGGAGYNNRCGLDSL